jgi:hypothetical protein
LLGVVTANVKFLKEEDIRGFETVVSTDVQTQAASLPLIPEPLHIGRDAPESH